MIRHSEVTEILDSLRRAGGNLSKKQILGAVSFSWGTLCNTVKKLTQLGILVVSEPEGEGDDARRRGRPHIPLRIVSDSMHFGAVDIGSSTTKLLVCDLDFQICWEDCVKTPLYTTRQAFLEWMRSLVEKMRRDSGVCQLSEIGISVSGTVDPTNGMLMSGGNWGMAFGTNITSQELEDAMGAAVYLASTQIASVCAEYHFGEFKGTADIVNIGLGVGIGSGVVSNHQLLYSRPKNMVGYIGHMLMPGNPYRCRHTACCFNGCLEAYSGGDNLARIAQELYPEHTELHDVAQMDIEAKAGNPLAKSLLDRAASYNAIGVATMVQSYSPDILVFSGRQVRKDGYLYEETIRHLYDIIPEERRTFRVAITTLGEKQAALGAVRLAYEAYFQTRE